MAASVAYGEANDPNSKKRKNKTKRSCTFCRELHKMCDDERPCKRCVSHGRGHLCYTPAPKPKRSNRMFSLMNSPTGLSPALITPTAPEASAANGLLMQATEEERVRNELEQQSKQQKIQQLQMQLQLAQRQLAQVQAQQQQQQQQSRHAPQHHAHTQTQAPTHMHHMSPPKTPLTPMTPSSSGVGTPSGALMPGVPLTPQSPSPIIPGTLSLAVPPSPVANPFDTIPLSSFGFDSSHLPPVGSSGADRMNISTTTATSASAGSGNGDVGSSEVGSGPNILSLSSSSANFAPLSFSGSYVVPYVMSSPVTGLDDIGSPSLSDFDPDLMLASPSSIGIDGPASPGSDELAENDVISSFYNQQETFDVSSITATASSGSSRLSRTSTTPPTSTSSGRIDPDVIILDTPATIRNQKAAAAAAASRSQGSGVGNFSSSIASDETYHMSMSLPFGGAGVSGFPGSRSQQSSPSSTTPATPTPTVTAMVDDDDDDDYNYDVVDYIHGSNNNNSNMPFHRERIGATLASPPPTNNNNATTKTSTSTFVNGLDRNVDIGQLVAAVDKLVLCPSTQQAAELTAGAGGNPQQRQSPGGSGNNNNKLARKDGGSTIQMCHAKMSDMMWRLADKINAQHFTPTLNTMFQRLLSVMLPKVALFDAKNTDFASLSVRFKVAIEMASEMQQPAVLANARCVIYANEHMHDLTGGLLHARSKQAEVDNTKIYDFDLFHPEDAIDYFSYSLDVISDKSNRRSRKFRVLSSGSPLGYVTCIVTQSVLFEQMTTMPMFTLLTFTNVDV